MTKQQKSLWAKLPQWAWKQGLRNGIDFTRNPDSSGGRPERERPQHCADIKQAQVITSRVEYPQQTDMHKPVLDIDFPIQCVPSTTEGHFHLFMDKELTWTQYRRLLDALTDAGIIEQGYRNASIAREYTAVRVPWVRKEPPAEPPTEPPAPEGTEPANAPQNGAQHPAEALPGFRAAPARPGHRFTDAVLGNIAAAYAPHHAVSAALEEEERLARQAALDAANRTAHEQAYNDAMRRAVRRRRQVPEEAFQGLRRESVTIEEEPNLPEVEGVREQPIVQGTIRYAQASRMFRITGAHAEGEEPRTLSISEEFYRDRMLGGQSIPSGLQQRLNRLGFEGRPIRRLFDSAYRNRTLSTGHPLTWTVASGDWAAAPSEPPLVGNPPQPF
ncbi:hypothetical protein SEA_OTTAWA_25 [Arthrobacter phage Ottawa]|nr:hypothetical protein SEA_KHARCHO_25 [Arthrobacter phage Kharcho]WIC89257.1 hypothetical protein SEA_OTTAWA_25 [Arthrobacter phage Ottawa]